MDTSVNQQGNAEKRWIKFYLAVVTEGRDVMNEVTKALYAGGTLRPDVYLKKHCHYSEQDYNDEFLFIQQEAISSWPKNEPYDIEKAVENPKWDITLHYKLQKTTCKLNKSLDDLVFHLKEVRNEISHEVPELSQIHLDKKQNELDTLYSQILKTLGKLKKRKYDIEIQKVHEKLQRRLSPTTELPSEITLQKIKDEIYDPETEYLSKIKLELLKQYDHLRSIYPGGLESCSPLHIADLFCIPKLKVADSDDSYISIGPIFPDQVMTLFKSKESNTKLVLIGHQGMGKTALFQYILDKWYTKANGINGLSQVDLLFYVDLQNVKTDCLCSLVKNYLLKESLMFVKTRNIIANLQKWRCVWLLDNFDNCKDGGRYVAKDICDSFSQVIIAIRPEGKSNLQSLNIKRIISLEFEAFESKCTNDIIMKLLLVRHSESESKCLLEKFMIFIARSTGVIGGRFDTPLQLSRLCLLWLEIHNKFESIDLSIQLCRELAQQVLSKVVDSFIKKTGEKRVIKEKQIINFTESINKTVWHLVSENSSVLHLNDAMNFLERSNKSKYFVNPVRHFTNRTPIGRGTYHPRIAPSRPKKKKTSNKVCAVRDNTAGNNLSNEALVTVIILLIFVVLWNSIFVKQDLKAICDLFTSGYMGSLTTILLCVIPESSRSELRRSEIEAQVGCQCKRLKDAVKLHRFYHEMEEFF